MSTLLWKQLLSLRLLLEPGIVGWHLLWAYDPLLRLRLVLRVKSLVVRLVVVALVELPRALPAVHRLILLLHGGVSANNCRLIEGVGSQARIRSSHGSRKPVFETEELLVVRVYFHT